MRKKSQKNSKQTSRKTRCELWKKPWKKYWTVICISKNKQFQKIIHMNIMGVPLSLCSKHAKSLYNLKCFFTTITFFLSVNCTCFSPINYQHTSRYFIKHIYLYYILTMKLWFCNQIFSHFISYIHNSSWLLSGTMR